jgi:RNA polymerase sigma-70 factor, ECF subfamily
VDKPTFEKIVSRFLSLLRRTIARSGVRRCDLEDVLQEVLKAVHRGLPVFEPSATGDPERALRAWMQGICGRQAANHHRARVHRREELRETGEIEDFCGEGPTAEEQLLNHEQAALLEEALDATAPERRAALLAHVLDEVPMVEIARRQGVPVNTAWNRVRLARVEVRAALGGVRRKRRR